MEQKYLSVKDLAEYLSVPVVGARFLASSQQLPAMKIGREWRFDREEIDKILATKPRLYMSASAMVANEIELPAKS